MNTICLIEYSEYKGQYKLDKFYAVVGCECFTCRGLRNGTIKLTKTQIEYLNKL